MTELGPKYTARYLFHYEPEQLQETDLGVVRDLLKGNMTPDVADRLRNEARKGVALNYINKIPLELGSTEAKELREEIEGIITTPGITDVIDRNPFLRIAFTISTEEARKESEKGLTIQSKVA